MYFHVDNSTWNYKQEHSDSNWVSPSAQDRWLKKLTQYTNQAKKITVPKTYDCQIFIVIFGQHFLE
jgi:hypothetical protein